MQDKTFFKAHDAISTALSISNNESADHPVLIRTKSGEFIRVSYADFCTDINVRESVVSGSIAVRQTPITNDLQLVCPITIIDIDDIESISY